MESIKANDDRSNSGGSKIDKYKWKVQDAQGQLMMLEKTKLKVDKKYQRDTANAKILNIARDWSWIACSSITVALRDNLYYVIDGQHRVAAAMKRSDILELPCICFKSTEITTEAKGFLTTNTQRKSITSFDKFKALLVTRNPEAIFVEKLIDDAGRVIGLQTNEHTVSCISLLLGLAKTDKTLLSRMWPYIVDLCDGYPIHSHIVSGLIYIEKHLKEDMSLTDEKWNIRIGKIGYKTLLGGATRASAYYNVGGARVFALGILEEINKGLRYRLSIGQDDTV